MLLFRSHWHIARERDPARETRLLAFAAPSPTPGQPFESPDSSTDDAEKDPNTMTSEEVLREMLRNQRAQTKAVVAPPPQKQAPAQGTVPESSAETAGGGEGEDPELTKREAMRKRFATLIESTQGIASQMQELKKSMENPDLVNKLREHAPPEAMKHWQDRIQLLEHEAFNTTQEQLFMEALLKFWDGELAPQAFMAEQGEYLKNLPYGFAECGDALHNVSSDPESVRQKGGVDAGLSENEWMASNQSSRIQTIQALLENIRMDDWMNGMELQNKEIKKVLDKEAERIEADETGIDTISSLAETDEGMNFADWIKTIRFYSIDNYIKALQQYWAALKQTWDQRAERYSADIARKFGQALKPFNVFPVYGEEVARILDQQLDAKSNEEAEAMQKKLEKDNANWEMLFGSGGEFWQFERSNPNKTRGILEYAADHGFLYDIDEDVSNPTHPVYGKNLVDLCYDWQDDPRRIDNYFTLLRTKNAAGRDKEVESGYKKEYDNEDPDRFIELLEIEMDDFNLWTAAGICKRAMERGFKGEIAAWLFTTILRKLRQHPELQAVTPKIFFDLIGKLSMYNTAFTLGWAKGYRRELRTWAKTGDDNVLEQTELKHLSVIEKSIVAKDPETDFSTVEGKRKLSHLTAQILAGQVVKLPGGYVHIFETRFKSYRERVKMMFFSLADPYKEDSDYATTITEKSMLPSIAFAKILDYQSTFVFKDPAWVAGFLGTIIQGAQQLKETPELREAYTNYCDEVRTKMDSFFGSYMKKEDRASIQFSLKDEKTGLPLIAWLVSENLLSWDVMKQAKAVAPLKQQIDEFFPGFDTGTTTVTPQKNTRSSGAGAASEPSVATAA